MRSPKPEQEFSQDLSAGALDFTTSFSTNNPFRLDQIFLHFDTAVSETVTITLDSGKGSDYDIVLQEVVLVSETDFVYRLQGNPDFNAGDQIRIQCTNTGGSGNVYGSVKASEKRG